MELGKYRKLIASLIGVTALVVMHYYNIEVPGIQPVVIDMLLGALTSLGVYQAPNDK